MFVVCRCTGNAETADAVNVRNPWNPSLRAGAKIDYFDPKQSVFSAGLRVLP
jgi:hypothetical protein